MLLLSLRSTNAARVMVSSIGVICGLIGIEHGFFELLQGDVVPQSHLVDGRPMIYAIGEANRFWQYGTEPAFTIIPNYLLTGILAVIVSLFVTLWVARFVQKQYGWLIFLLLSILQYLVGGGAAQIGLAIVVGLVAICINTPLTWVQFLLPVKVREWVAIPWFGLLLVFCVIQCLSIITAIFGWFFGVSDPQLTENILWSMLYVMIGILPLAIISVLAHDSLRTTRKSILAHEGGTYLGTPSLRKNRRSTFGDALGRIALNVTLTTQADRVKRRKILKKTQKVVGPQPEMQPEPDSGRAKPVHFFWKLSTQTLWQPPKSEQEML